MYELEGLASGYPVIFHMRLCHMIRFMERKYGINPIYVCDPVLNTLVSSAEWGYTTDHFSRKCTMSTIVSFAFPLHLVPR